MSTKAFSLSGNTVAICSIMSFSLCLFLRTAIIIISIAHLVYNFSGEELNLANAKQLVDELDTIDIEQLEDATSSKDDSVSRTSGTEDSTLIHPRKRTREAIVEVNSHSELSYVIEKYRCVAVLYQDGSEVRNRIKPGYIIF